MSTCEENWLRLQCCLFQKLFDSLEVAACYAGPRIEKQDAVEKPTACQFSVTVLGGPAKSSYQDPDKLKRQYMLRVLWTVR